MVNNSLKSMRFAPVGGKRPRFLKRGVLLASLACLAATGGAVAWNSMHPRNNPVEAAASHARVVTPNSPEATSVSARLLELSRQPVEALRDLELRGDRSATDARTVLLHWLNQEGPNDVTVDQIRGRLAGMNDAEFLAWLKQALR